MVDTLIYDQDPGAEVLTGLGSVLNIVKEGEVAAVPAFGLGTLGLIGTVPNDKGAPNVPILLPAGADDIFASYGGYKSWLGGGEATGYNGNLPAHAYGLGVPRIVLQPADMALRDKTITDATAALLYVSVMRGWTITGDESNERLTTDRAHLLQVGDTVAVSDLTGGAGATAGTYVVATVPSSTEFTLTGFAFTSNITAGRARPVVAAAHPLNAYVLPAGTRISTSNGSFVVATLEPVAFGEDVTAVDTVRVQKVSGTEAAMNTVATFVDAPTETLMRVVTTVTTVPYAMSGAEIALRYTNAFKALNANPDGMSVTIAACDRTDASVLDAFANACADHKASGFVYKIVVAAPIGTTAAAAEGTSGDGLQRSTLTGKVNVHGVHPGWRRTFLLDAANLVGPKYKARFPGAIPLAASMTTIRPEQNPARPSPVIQRWGADELETTLTFNQRVTHFKAGIMTPEFRRVRPAGLMPAHRDGVLLNGAKSADERLWDFLAQGLTLAVEPFMQDVAGEAERQDMRDNADAWLDGLARPQDGGRPRIKAYNVTVVWDADNEMATLVAVVQKNGNMDIITIRLRVTADEVVPVAA